MNDKLFVILEKIHQNISQKNIADWCCKEYGITPIQALEIINKLHFLSTMQLGKIPTQTLKKGKNNSSLITFYSQKTYSFQNHSFLFSYGTDEIEKLFHPQLAHLEVCKSEFIPQKIFLYLSSGNYQIKLNGNFIGSWKREEEHFFKGRVFEVILNTLYSCKWMGVLHASAIGNNKNSLLFLGNSGSGKSTATALAVSNGQFFIADDFVAVNLYGEAFVFPAALSLKGKTIDLLGKHFLDSNQYVKNLDNNRSVHHLSLPIIQNSNSRKVKHLVFVDYNLNVDFEFKSLNKQLAFQSLVLDSWISPDAESAAFFMKWMGDTPCYSLRYSNIDKMLKTINTLLENDT